MLKNHKLCANKSKCSLGVKETEYLSFILKGDVVAINPHKESGFESWTTPESKRVYNPF